MKFNLRSVNQDAIEMIGAWEFFDFRTDGFFVEVGANDPKTLSQTWLLEKVGWRGILVEPLPDKAELLSRERPHSAVCPVAVGSPDQVGEADFHVAGVRSALVPNQKSERTEYSSRIRVKVVTLKSILEEWNPERIDYLSIDTEGNELNVLKGFDFNRYRPSLLVVEDSVYTLTLHKYLASERYRLVRRIGDNNWYVPGESPAVPFLLDRIRLFRKMYLGTPLRSWKFHRKIRKRSTGAPP